MSAGLVVLHQQDELGVLDVGGTAVGLALAPIQSAWLPSIERAMADAAARAGGPVLSLAVFRLDPRFPLRPGFDGNLADLARTQRAMSTTVRATAAVLEFGGIVGATMRTAIATVNRVVPTRSPTSVHGTVFEGMRWLEGYLRPEIDRIAWRREITGAVRFARELLDATEP